MFKRWTDLYRGDDEHTYSELTAFLVRNDFRHKTAFYTQSNRMTLYGAAGNGLPGVPNTRSGYVNPSVLSANRETEKRDQKKIYHIRVLSRDLSRIRALQKEQLPET